MKARSNHACSVLRTPAIKIVVGTGELQEEFFVHEGILCERSQFFEKALNGDRAESDERLVNLPEDDPATFSLYQELLYTHTLHIKKDSEAGLEQAGGIEEATIVEEEFTALSKLYVLAEKLMDKRTKTVVLDSFYARVGQLSKTGDVQSAALDCVRIIYGGTRTSSSIRDLLVAFYTDYGDRSFLPEEVENVPSDFLYDISRSMLKKRPRQDHVNARLQEKEDEKSEIIRVKDNKLQKKETEVRQLRRELADERAMKDKKKRQLNEKAQEIEKLKATIREKDHQLSFKDSTIWEKDAEIRQLKTPSQPKKDNFHRWIPDGVGTGER